MRAEPRPYLPFAIGAGLLVALVALALLQYRWIAKLSEAERERLQASLDSAATRFCDDVDRELSRASQAFPPAEEIAEGDLASRLARWRSTAPEPRLVRELLVVSRLGRGEVELHRFDERSGRLVPSSWEADLGSLRRIFESRGRVPRLDENLPGIILPVREPPPRRGGEPPEPGERRPPRDHLVVRLDRAFLTNEFLPRVAERDLGGSGDLAYAVTVSVAEMPGNVLFRGGPRIAERAASGKADAMRRLFALRQPAEPADRGEAEKPPRREPRGPEPPGGTDPPPEPGPEAGRWLLEVRHPSGSLPAAVAGARRRNLAISLGVLVLLATAIALLVDSTRRAQRLARQQMEFVAAVSHELKTPLTAMRSAGQNLADGIVDDPEKVRTYGALIEREGRRLTEMVGRVLAFAGIRSGSQTFRSEPVAVRALVDGVLADSRWVIEEKRVEVEVEVAEDLPGVRGDEAALRQALANLVDNALKYGGSGRWIGVRARVVAGPRGEEVILAVSDRGIGVRRGDLPRLFEPFFRSGEASVAGIAGSGLGLSVVRGIVEAHGGYVTAESIPGKGSTFTIHLPLAPAPAVTGSAT